MSFRFLFIIIMPLLCFDSIVLAQGSEPVIKNKVSGFIGIKLGYGDHRMRDRAISSLGYNGGAIPIQIDLGYDNTKYKMFAGYMMANGTINTKTNEGFKYQGDLGQFIEDTIAGLNHSQVKLTHSRFNISLLGRINKSDNLKIFIGGTFVREGQSKRFLNLVYQDSLRDIFTSFGISAQVEYLFHSRHTLQYTLAVPVLSHINRTLYFQNGDPYIDKYSSWETFNKFVAFNSRLSYSYMLNRRWSLEACYLYNFTQISFPRKGQMAFQSLTAGINLHF